MVHDPVAALKIFLVVLLSTAAIAGFIAFNEGKEAGLRAASLVFPLALVVGLLQIVKARYAPYILGPTALLLAGALYLRHRRKR